MGNITLVTGGAKSGKSEFALSTCNSFSGRKVFIATAQAFDSEMTEKIERHKLERNSEWLTHETNHKNPVESLFSFIAIENEKENENENENEKSDKCIILIDCLTLWISNIMLNHTGQMISEDNISIIIDNFVIKMKSSKADFILVTNEVGNSVTPDNKLARRFTNLSGLMNKIIAKNANNLYMVVCGIPLKIK